MEDEKLVAVISPWERLADAVKAGFRVESLPAGKGVVVWRADLHDSAMLEAELKSLGITPLEVRMKRVVTKWDDR